MLSIKIDEKNNIVTLEPNGALSKTDFDSASVAIDPIIIKYGQLNGLIIHTQYFPGWDSFAALISHLKFIKNHHQKISHIAIVTDSKIANFAKIIAGHFVNAKIRRFSFTELEGAKSWIILQRGNL